MSEHVCAVAIMAKASVAGTVKTRLVPPLSHEEAAEFNTSCLTDVATNIVAAAAQAPIQGFAAYHPIGSEQFFEEVLLDGFKLLPPREPRIGRSLFHAARADILRRMHRLGEAKEAYRRALDLLAPRGLILIDNVLWDGDVLKQPAPDEKTAAIQELNRVVATDPRVTAVLVTVRDGILVIRSQS